MGAVMPTRETGDPLPLAPSPGDTPHFGEAPRVDGLEAKGDLLPVRILRDEVRYVVDVLHREKRESARPPQRGRSNVRRCGELDGAAKGAARPAGSGAVALVALEQAETAGHWRIVSTVERRDDPLGEKVSGPGANPRHRHRPTVLVTTGAAKWPATARGSR